jgi:hypothetical protein
VILNALPWAGLEPGLLRPQRRVLTTRRSRLLEICMKSVWKNNIIERPCTAHALHCNELISFNSLFFFKKNYILVMVKKKSAIKIKFRTLLTQVRNSGHGSSQRRTAHITRWEKSHEAPLVWGPLRQSEGPHHHDHPPIRPWQ